MKTCVSLSLLVALAFVHVRAAPVDNVGPEQGSCEDAFAIGAAKQALTKINQDRKEGYIFTLHRLSNVHLWKHGEDGVVFYLTLDVEESDCPVVSRKDWKLCEARSEMASPVYGQCKAIIFINRVQRVVRLEKYDCTLRPIPPRRLNDICPDCPTVMGLENDAVQKAVSLSMEKFNKENGLKNHFVVKKVLRATAGMAMGMMYNVEYTIMETTCPKGTDIVAKCPIMGCEFAHSGFCQGSLMVTPPPDNAEVVSVDCEIYEPEAAEREKKLHLLGAGTDHSHNDTATHTHDHDAAHSADKSHVHDHVHDHTKSHTQHDQTHVHPAGSDHHHSHDHADGSSHSHGHGHEHDHGHGHDHVHAHHAKAHDHSGDSPNQHHAYPHAADAHTHEHDHELALDHDHKHVHEHDHEHHHHHHDHDHETEYHDHPEGKVTVLPHVEAPVTLPAFPQEPTQIGVTLPAVPDPQIPGAMRPVILPFPKAVSAQCPRPLVEEDTIVKKLFKEDPAFNGTL